MTCLVHQSQFSLLRKGSLTTRLTLEFLLAVPSSIEAENQFGRHKSLEAYAKNRRINKGQLSSNASTAIWAALNAPSV